MVRRDPNEVGKRRQTGENHFHRIRCQVEELGILAAESETFGDKSFKPFEGDKAENL